ncbi:MAG TPA: hypothetical protein VGK47_11150, partial [Nitrososphaeraceae archaeon]
MGLDPYNPGEKPSNSVSNDDIRSYINQNTRLTPVNNGENFEQHYAGVYAKGPNGGTMFKNPATGQWIESKRDPNQKNIPTQYGHLPKLSLYPQALGTSNPNPDPFEKEREEDDGDSQGQGETVPEQNKRIYGQEFDWGSGPIADAIMTPDNMHYQVIKKHLEDEKLNSEAYKRDIAEWQQNKDWYERYKAEGPLTSAQISDKVSNLPGYQAELGQGVDAIGKSASASGYLGSGKLLKELMGFGQNTLSKYYSAELSRLAGLAGMGQDAANQSAGLATNAGAAGAGLYSALGDSSANSLLAGFNSLMQGQIMANQKYKTVQIGHSTSKSESGGGGIGSILSGLGSLAGAFL